MPHPLCALRPSVAALLLAAGLGAPALGQCTVYRIDMPDFDQQRATLPNDGLMYCSPTATANALAYLSNHGYPDLFDGPRHWQSQTHDADVSDFLRVMGVLMSTSPTDGTDGAGWKSGMNLLVAGEGIVTASAFASGFAGISPHQLADQMRLGGVVLPVIGWYDDLGSGRWRRNGGHVITMWGAFNTCDQPQDMFLAFHDPGNDDLLTTQSGFATTTTDFTTDPAWTFRYTSESTYYPRQVMRMNANNGFLDGFKVILPLYGITSELFLNDITFTVPKPATDDPEPIRFTIDLPTPAEKALAVAIGSLPTEGFVLTQVAADRIGTLYHARIVDGVLTPIADFPTPRGMVMGRDGCAYVASAASIDCYGLTGPDAYGLTHTIDLPARADAMHYDDAADELIVLSMATGRLMRLDKQLGLLANDAIPAGVALTGDGSVTVNPVDGKAWVAATGSPVLTRLVRDALGRLVVDTQTTLPGVASPASLQFDDDGVLYIADDGAIKSFVQPPRGGWERSTSPLDGLASGPVFLAGRGRTNFDPATMEDVNILPPPGDPGAPDCRVDLDLDGALTIFDFLTFQNFFDTGSTNADFDYDGALTIFDFLAFQNAFDAGC
jgi:hypothetical protein